jgi:hypothetical protein
MHYLVGRYGVSIRRACRVVGVTRSSVYYTSTKDPLPALRPRRDERCMSENRLSGVDEPGSKIARAYAGLPDGAEGRST